ncbi:MAG: benzoate 1,2-dioxygenase electron transfer component BenC [Dermatophilus congolensis]|nr:benzoate 1,2-dioxygenase electron transfer component BenC [Dermatophilus congolensis]
MSYSVALSFEDGITKFIKVDAGQTVADASYRQRINIPLDCRDGACGTCKAYCESGEYDPGFYVDDALTDDEAADGYCLPCQMTPKSDLVLQIASTSAVAKTQAITFDATVTGVERLSDTVIRLTVEIPNRDKLAFLPGQYVNFHVPGSDETRSYSFSSGPSEEALSFLVKLTPGGLMSTWLDERAKVGDKVKFTGPNGSFFLRDTDRPVLLLAGGTGLAPILSILRRMREQESQRQVHLVYGASADVDVVELDALEALAAELPSFTWDYCVAANDTKAKLTGYVTAHLRDEHLHGGDVAVYLCGPPAMVEAVRGHFKAEGVEPTGFYFEKFALANQPGAAEVAAATAAPVEGAAGADAVELPSDEGVQVTVDAAASGSAAAVPQGLLVEAGGALIENTDAYGTAGKLAFDSSGVEPLVVRVDSADVADVSAGGYQIGEEHPDIDVSDSIFEARAALELGALELTIGRLTQGQIHGYRLLAEATVPYVDGDRFVDAAAYTDTNAAFHDYLFMLSRNQHLLDSYQRLGVKGEMESTLKQATWCHPQCTQDHLDMVDAIEAGDRERARQLFLDHAQRSMETMRRARRESREAATPQFVTPGRFRGQVVVVTGAAQGIGERVARRVAAEDGLLVLADRSELVNELADDLVERGQAAVGVIADLETYEGAASVVAAALQKYGRVDVAIHNVGGAISFKPFEEFTPEQIDAEIQRSLMTTLYSCRAVLPTMLEAGSGTILNVSSIATGGIYRVPYAAAKGGVNAITRALAVEAAPRGVRVVATAPGGTEAPPRRIARGPAPSGETEQEWFQAHIDQTLDSALMHRYGTLDEQAAAITFLASREASYITGSVLPVGGGDLG